MFCFWLVICYHGPWLRSIKPQVMRFVPKSHRYCTSTVRWACSDEAQQASAPRLCKPAGALLVWLAHRRTLVVIFASRMRSAAHPPNLRASAGGRLFRRRRNSANSRAVAGANLLSSRQAAGVLMLHATTEALLVTSTVSASTLRLLQPRWMRRLC